MVGIKCAHSYAHTSSSNKGSRVQADMLKGVDAFIYSSLVEQLHLSVDVKVVAENKQYERVKDEMKEEAADREHDDDSGDGSSSDEDERDDNARLYVSGVMTAAGDSGFCSNDDVRFDMQQILGRRFQPFHQPVCWLNGDRGSREFAASYTTYGNEPGSASMYTEVALLVHVPAYSRKNGVGARVAGKETSKAQSSSGRKRGRGEE